MIRSSGSPPLSSATAHRRLHHVERSRRHTNPQPRCPRDPLRQVRTGRLLAGACFAPRLTTWTVASAGGAAPAVEQTPAEASQLLARLDQDMTACEHGVSAVTNQLQQVRDVLPALGAQAVKLISRAVEMHRVTSSSEGALPSTPQTVKLILRAVELYQLIGNLDDAVYDS